MLNRWLIRIWALVILTAAVVAVFFAEFQRTVWYVRLALIILFVHGLISSGAMLRGAYRPEQLKTRRMSLLVKAFWVVVILAAVAIVIGRVYR